jgi:hypothetical protein
MQRSRLNEADLGRNKAGRLPSHQPQMALPQDWSELKKDLHRKIWVNTELCIGRRVAFLMKHWMMLGPSQARKGDYVAFLNGSSVPWVLRKQEGEFGYYEVMGQCFVDGVMYCEAASWSEDEADVFVLI